ncbi:HET-domain-containing protein [Apiospora arundinis]|uniref:HET-domain-containing protein n=1 Tax=Apiospora arundinis TaxID=335852 RepID=A0ABR2IS72_9PEZI
MSELKYESLSEADRDASRSNVPCAHTQLQLEGRKRVTFSQFESFSDSCRFCRLYRDSALALAKGDVPSLFKPESMNEAEENLFLQDLVIFYNAYQRLIFHISGQDHPVTIFRDTDMERDFTVQGRRFPEGFRVGRHTNSKMTFTFARKWLSECLTRHTCSKPSSEAVPLPGRLLQVQGSANDSIRLVETQGSECPYVALSHRWGDPRLKQLKTTTRTMQSHMDQIPWHDLPATFRDAVTVCRSMDVVYLWIDSLCILQAFEDITPDEREATEHDFAQENSIMARTYQNSHFTISADISTHMDSGMFSQLPLDDHAIEVMADDGKPASLYIGQEVNHYRDETPCIETRGWTLQEFLLPPRVLHFGEFDVEWRCKQRLTCECGDLDRERSKQVAWHRHHFMEKATEAPPTDHEGALRWWEVVVHQYTSRQLTNPSDKLPALSGLAQLRKRVKGGVYLAGLWKDSILHDLCWYHTLNYNVATSGGVSRRPPNYRAPSWSWASVDTDSGCSWWWTGVIGLHPISPEAEPKPACTILGSACEPKTSDPTGEVRSGFLDIKVALIPVEICADPDQEVVWTVHNIGISLDLEFFKPDCELEEDGLSLGGSVYCAPIAETAGFTRTGERNPWPLLRFVSEAMVLAHGEAYDSIKTKTNKSTLAGALRLWKR